MLRLSLLFALVAVFAAAPAYGSELPAAGGGGGGKGKGKGKGNGRQDPRNKQTIKRDVHRYRTVINTWYCKVAEGNADKDLCKGQRFQMKMTMAKTTEERQQYVEEYKKERRHPG